MEAVAARAAVLEQAQVDKVVQRVPGILDRHPAGDCGEGGVGVLAGHHGEPPEHPLPGFRSSCSYDISNAWRSSGRRP